MWGASLPYPVYGGEYMSKPRGSRISKEALVAMSVRVGIPISEYVNGRKPVINGRYYQSFAKAYQYLYNHVRTRK